MSESQCVRVDLRPGMTERFVGWARSLNDRGLDILEAMRAEGVLAEHIFLERGTRDSLVFYLKAVDLGRAARAFEASCLLADVEAKRIIAETWDLATMRTLEAVIELP
jgi:hypothetical protein